MENNEQNQQNHSTENERTVKWTGERFSTRAFRFQTILWGLLLIVCAIVALVYKKPWPNCALCHWGIWLIVPVVMLIFTRIRAIWMKYSIRYELKGESLICERGIFSKKLDTILIQQIQDVVMVQNIIDRFVNKVGTVKLRSSDTTDPDLELKGLEHPQEAFDELGELRKLFARRRGVMSFGSSPLEDQNH